MERDVEERGLGDTVEGLLDDVTGLLGVGQAKGAAATRNVVDPA